MTRLRSGMVLTLLVIFGVGAWLWRVGPESVDMATYAPASSLLYLESTRPLAVFETVVGTDTWKIVDLASGTQPDPLPNRWLQSFIRWTGIGPIKSVILARSQLAVVVTDLGTTEDGESLRVKPQGALLIETHTSERRIRPTIEEELRRFAIRNFGEPTLRRTTIDGVEFTEWTSPEGSRQIVATILGSLVIVGNTEQAVRNCLAVYARRIPSLKEDPELGRMRTQLSADRALTFGYVPAANSARLLSVGVPLILGRSPGDSEFQRLIAKNSSKVLGSLGWSSQQFRNGIEDRYLISIEPSIVAHLKASFYHAPARNPTHRLPDRVHSVTYYNFEDPLAVWQDFKGAASSQMDMLSAVFFSSLLKSALQSYGVDDPERFLSGVKGELLTLRLDQNGERTMLIAGVRDQILLRDLIAKRIGPNSRGDRVGDTEILEDHTGEWAAGLNKDLVVMGPPSDIRRYVDGVSAKGPMMKDEDQRKITLFVPLSSLASIVTYTDDSDRIRNFVSAALAARGMRRTVSIEPMVAGLPYSATETTLGERGFERVTKSPLGQFAIILPLLIPEKANLELIGTQSK